jgi:hypothetical protein
MGAEMIPDSLPTDSHPHSKHIDYLGPCAVDWFETSFAGNADAGA